jgi:hypothetical protein
MILMKNLGIRKVCVKVAQKTLTNAQQQKRSVDYAESRMMNSSTES